jgi:hypothetical protein
MAVEYKHKRYFRIRLMADNSLYTFANTTDANNKIAFKDAWNTNTPNKTQLLENSNQTFVVTYEFDSNDKQMEFKSAVDATWSSGGPFNGNDSTQKVEHFKTEWLYPDGTVSATTNFES